ncbi:MAG TPA: TetR/AcrR family transcriptional regulator [Clostridia bacterium]|nr:TetR/AcrR family transcriptional regulator [Clostridia bacterium]
MAEKKKDKTTLTQQLITFAYFDLLRMKSDKDITISEICLKAQVARKTFYNNFDSKDEILNAKIKNFIGSWDTLFDDRTISIEDVYRSIFNYVYESRDFFYLLYSQNMFRNAEEKLTDYCQIRWIYNEAYFPVGHKFVKYYIPATIALFVNILKTWVSNGFSDSIEDMVELTNELVLSGN